MKLRTRMLLIGMLLLMVVSFPIGAAAQVPHYFPAGMEQLNEPADQWEAYLRAMNALDICRGTNGAQFIPRDFSRSITVEKEYWGKKTTFIFDPYIRVGDKIVFYDFCGATEVTEEQFAVSRDDFIAEFERAWEVGYDYYRELEVLAVRARAQAVGKSEEEFRANLDDELPDAPGVTYRERQLLPNPVQRSDFVPGKEIHMGYNPYFGVAWLNSGTIWVTPQARIADYIHGYPRVALHESIHSNENLQSYPLSNGVDVEMMASVPMFFFENEHIGLARHGYAGDVRDIIRWYFGYDFSQVNKEVITFDHAGNLRVDREKFNDYYGKLREVKSELRASFLGFLAEYYAHRAFWSGFHEKMQDDAAFLRVMMITNYDLTAAGGREETMRFLQMNHKKIMQYAHESYLASGGGGTGSGLSDDESESGPRMPSREAIRQIEALTGMSVPEMLALAEKHGVTLKDVQKMSRPEIISMAVEILQKEAAFAERGLR